MAIDVRALFKIVGEDGPALHRVEEAMKWLLSPSAEGMGQKLLYDAHALHGKPITIAIEQELECAYLNGAGEHTLRINPGQIDKIFLVGADGGRHAMSVERTLAHELTHAAQLRAPQGAQEIGALKAKLHGEYMAHFTTEELEMRNMPILQALEAPDYDAAIKHVERYVDDTGFPAAMALNKQLQSHPDFIRHVEEFEAPAVHMENRVAALRNEPINTGYATAHQFSDADYRQMLIEELSGALELSQKPRLADTPRRADGKLWSEALGKRTGRSPDPTE